MGGSFQIPCGGLHERNPRTIYEYLWRLQTSYVLHVDLIGTGSHQDPQHAILFLYILVFGPLSTFIRSFTTRLYTLFFVWLYGKKGKGSSGLPHIHFVTLDNHVLYDFSVHNRCFTGLLPRCGVTHTHLRNPD